MKHHLISAIIMALSLVPSISKSQNYDFSAENEDGATIYYKIISEEEKTCGVTSMPVETGSIYTGNIVIPSTANGYTVTGINNLGFMNSEITSVNIPNSVTSIGDWAFCECKNLVSIIIPDRVTYVGNGAFQNCTGLISISFPNSVTTIGEYAFSGCEKLSSFRIPESVTSIQYETFSGCTSLNTIYIPSSVNHIGWGVFYGCNNLQKVIVEDIASWCNIYFESMGDYPSIYYSNPLQLGRLYSDENTEITDLIIPNTVKIIKDFAFNGCNGLKSVTIPNSVTTIGYEAFRGCSGLKSVTIPGSGVTTIGQEAFYNCSSLSSLTIGSGVTTIEQEAFRGCSQLKTILIPNSVEHILENAFHGTAWYDEHPDGIVYAGEGIYKYKGKMAEGTSIVLEDGTKKIFYGAFSGCSGLMSIEIPSSVISIDERAFSNCKNLSTVYSEITDFFDIPSSVFYGSSNTTLYVPKGMATTYRASTGWSVIKYIEEMPDDTPDASFLISCSNRGSVSINGSPTITSKIAAADINEGTDNTFTFTPKPGCRLDQVTLNGLDITANVEGNTLTCTIPANSQMIVTFTTEQGDINNDGTINIADVVAIVNKILGN